MSIKLQRTKNVLKVPALMTLADGASLSDGDRLKFRAKDGKVYAVFKYTSPTGGVREAGLGILHRDTEKDARASLASIRAKADHYRALLDKVDDEGKSIGVDPLEDRDQKRAAAKAKKDAEKRRLRFTLEQCADDFHVRVIDKKRSTRHGLEWIGSIKRHIPQRILQMPVDQITPPMVFDALAPIQAKVPETAGRIRQRLQTIFDDLVFREIVRGNPVTDAIKGKLAKEVGDQERTHYRALDYKDVPAFMTALKERGGVAHRLLEFTILCACRTNESRMMVWPEIDLTTGVWTIPGSRMKAGKEHTITLPPRALEIVLTMKETQKELGVECAYVFMSPMKKDKPLSNMAMLIALQKMGYRDKTVAHGFRSSFSDWAYTHTPFRAEVIESCLAHTTNKDDKNDKTRRAYLRTSFPEQRAALLRQWHDYVLGEAAAGANVVPMRAA